MISRSRKIQDEGDSAAEKMFRMLDILAHSPTPLDANDLCDAMDANKPSIVRMMKQMEDDGIIKRQLGSKGYIPARRLSDLALQSLLSWASTPQVRELLSGVVSRTGETCNFGILFDGEVVYLERVECDRPIRVQLTAGSAVPAHCTAIGKIMLSYMPAASRRQFFEAAPLGAHTSMTVTNWNAVEAQVAVVLECGFAADKGEYVNGLGGIAVPVRDADGDVFAGLAVHAPVDRLGDDDVAAHVTVLKEAAAKLSACLP